MSVSLYRYNETLTFTCEEFIDPDYVPEKRVNFHKISHILCHFKPFGVVVEGTLDDKAKSIGEWFIHYLGASKVSIVLHDNCSDPDK